jgi:hypothetical protein
VSRPTHPHSPPTTLPPPPQSTAELRAAFDRALASGDAAGLAEARLEASAVLLQLYGELRAHRVRPALRLWLQAGLYSTLELVADADEAILAGLTGQTGAAAAVEGVGDAEAAAASVAACLGAIEAASPGSDLHIQLAARWAAAARRMAEAELAAEAAQRCQSAHVVRYGAGLVGGEFGMRLLQISERLSLSWLHEPSS